MINPIYSYTRAARELVSIRSGISHAKRASREKQAAAPNNRRTYEREVNQTGIPSWRREEGRSTGKRRQISTGAHPGDAAGTPSFPNHGPKIHRDRISRHSKPGYQRSSNRLCLELTQLAPSRGHASNHMLPVSSSKPQAASYKDSSFKRQASSVLHKASSFKPQATSCRMQEPS
jgi:hypothetical protein